MIATQTLDVNSLGAARLKIEQALKKNVNRKAPGGGKLICTGPYIDGCKRTIEQLAGRRKHDAEIRPIKKGHRILTPEQKAKAPHYPGVPTEIKLGNNLNRDEIRKKPPRYDQRAPNETVLTFLRSGLKEFEKKASPHVEGLRIQNRVLLTNRG